MAGSTEHRRSPRKEIVQIKKVGTWGNIEYHHVLSCGHIEIRPRASRAPKLACAWCLRAESKEQEMLALVQAPLRVREEVNTANYEHDVQSLRASISNALKVNIEAVDIVVKDVGGKLEVQHVLVFLSAYEARMIAGRTQA
jgi:hypothetical protein